jgi:hypothetical protein
LSFLLTYLYIIIVLLHNSQRITTPSIDGFFSIHWARKNKKTVVVSSHMSSNWLTLQVMYMWDSYSHRGSTPYFFMWLHATSSHGLRTPPVKHIMKLLVLLSWHSLHRLSWVIAHAGFTHWFICNIRCLIHSSHHG